MFVRPASISVRDAGATASLMQEWRGYYFNGGLAAMILPCPQQTRINVTVDDRSVPFRASGFTVDNVLVLASVSGSNVVIFYDPSLNDGKGGFLSAAATLSVEDRTQLGARRSRRERFLRELITAAKAAQPPAPAKAKTRV